MLRSLSAASLALAASACSTDHDCSLNGVCSSGSCKCDEPWHGIDCGMLETRPAAPGGMYGYSPNVSSWGGNVVRGDDGMHHLYVAEMKYGGLKGWAHSSECVHATSANVSGPYVKQDVAVGPWCHNPMAIRDPSGEYVMFHIGEGSGVPRSAFLHHAKGPGGPWEKYEGTPPKCNNPAPAYHPNGTLFLVCNNFGLTHADGWNASNWAPVRSIPSPGGDPERHWEDAFLWFDRRGSWHLVYHVYCLQPYASGKECYSGHAFSHDGFDWTFSGTEPFNGTVQFTDGTAATFSTRERPKMIFAASDAARTKPIGVITGVSSQPVSPACDSCYDHTCSQCKITSGRDWTYTVLQPFAGFQ
eukprot:TRINITY_DN33041_c0_g1_i1.p1 TRINITY_DN33041_c0_g1~~TRINITY_DN33041_c0_g1_i1.p1  ORF type:complete len:358 (+),score=102.20 TRINITY_DN33041_c0_g1_i1:54-1127(+)